MSRKYPVAALAPSRRKLSLAQRIVRQRPGLVLVECLGVLALAALLYLSQVAATAEAGSQVQSLQAAQQQLLRQDAALQSQLGSVRDPATIAARARAQGFAPPPQFVVVGGLP